jgi:hypothetical protein
MTCFSIDLLRPGAFARTPFEKFLLRQGGKRLAIAYAFGALLLLLGGVTYWQRTAPLRAALSMEQQQLRGMQAQTAQRQQELTQMRNQFQGIGELEKFQVVWSEVLEAVSERIPGSLWLNRVELVQPETKPGAQAPAPSSRLLRFEIQTELWPGSTPLLDVAKFLDELGRDPRFAQRFQLMDWEASSATTSAGSGEARKDQMLLTVNFKVML